MMGSMGEPLHIPVLETEVVDLMNIVSDGTYVDATIGGGGHAERILSRLGPSGLLIGIDIDVNAIETTRERLKSNLDRLKLVRGSFAEMDRHLRLLGCEEVDGVVFDFGVSSLQLECPERGFSFRTDGPLDMRMSTDEVLTASDLVARMSEQELASLLRRFGEERRAREIARAIVRVRKRNPIVTTTQLAEIVRKAVGPTRRKPRIDPATKTFQAFRIAVNNELENISNAIDAAVRCLKAGGRLCAISFQSLEDRIVKRKFVGYARRCTCPPDLPRCACSKSPILRIITRHPVRPGEAEIRENPRSRSARLRVAEKAA